MADRYNPENLIKIGLISSGVLNLVLFFIHDYIAMLILWGLNGVAQFAVWPAIVKIITSQLTPNDRKNGVFYITFASTGGLLLSYLTAALITQWEYNFLVSAAILLGLAVLWVAECHKVDHFMIPDSSYTPQAQEKKITTDGSGEPFIISGFIFIVIFFFFRTLVDQAIKTFSPTMLTELYPGVTPSVGNLLNILIIGVTLIGAVVIRKLYPKRIHSETMGMFLIALLSLPFCGVLLLAGKVEIALVVFCLCMVACFLNCGTVLVNCSNLRFAKYGKSATAAGIVNAVASGAFIVVNYGMALLADLFDWQVVLYTWFGLVSVAMIAVAFAISKWRKFVNSDEEK